MARAAKTVASAARTRRRLTPDQKNEIAESLKRGEAGNAIAERMGISAATVYAQRRKGAQIGEPVMQGDSGLRRRLVNFAVRTLLGQQVGQDERDELEREVREELVKRIAAGI